MTKLLIVEDEEAILSAMRRGFEYEGYSVVTASDGQSALRSAKRSRPDLVVLDLGLPDQPGDAVCREIRKWSTVPILVLSARHSDHEKVRLLDAGADDYVTKPFSTAELQARVRARLRRARIPHAREDAPLEVDGLLVDVARRVVQREGVSIHLTPTEWDLLRTFVRHRGRTLTHPQLFRAVWNRSDGDPQQYLRVHVANLRRKIERDSLRPRLVLTEPGVGYRFEASP